MVLTGREDGRTVAVLGTVSRVLVVAGWWQHQALSTKQRAAAAVRAAVREGRKAKVNGRGKV